MLLLSRGWFRGWGGPVLAVSTLVSGLGSLSATAGQDVEGREHTWHFGYLPQKSTVNAVFRLVNQESEPMQVTRIEPGCSCTSVTELAEAIAPGDTATVEVTLKSGRYLNDIRKTTKVYIQDSDEPAFLLTIQARVFKRGESAGPYRLSPPVLEFKTESGRLAEYCDTVLLTNQADHAVSLRSVHYPEAYIETVQLPGPIQPGASGAIIIGIDENQQAEMKDGWSLTLAVEALDTTLVTVPIEIKD